MLIKDLLLMQPNGQLCEVCAWVRSKREGKKYSFVMLSDGSSLENLQVVIDNSRIDTKVLKKLQVGASCRIKGALVASKGTQVVEIQLVELFLIGESPEDYPLQKKYHGPEFLRGIAHLRPRTNTFGAIMRIRSQMSFAVHDFFRQNHFVHFHSPIITPHDAEGGGELFHISSNSKEHFFGRPAFLTVTGQLEAEAYACALGRVYTFGPTFRAENANTYRHAAEFWMIEPEIAFCDLNQLIELGQDFLRFLVSYALKYCKEDLDFLLKDHPHHLERLQVLLEKPFQILTYTDAIEKLLVSKAHFEQPVAWGMDLQSEHERYLTEHLYCCPIALTHHPKDLKAFYMKQDSGSHSMASHTVASVDFLLEGIGEVIGGSQREDSFQKLEKAMQEQGINSKEYQWYLDLRYYGSVPHSGFGMGFERFLQYLTQVANIRDVIPFPRTVGSLYF